MRLSPISLAITRLGRPADPDAAIKALFAAGEQGAWYNPSDLSTMFQTTTGNTPVTADGQPVGLILDKSKGLALGPELITNGNFNNGSTGWILGTGWTVSSGVATFTPGTNAYIYQSISGVAGKTLKVTLTVIQGTAVLGSSTYGVTTSLGVGTHTLYVKPVINEFSIWANSLTSVDNISAKELAGNHASQATAAARPLYKTDGTYSWLQFDGVDDCLSTSAIDLTSTNKMSVYYGARKVAEDGPGIVFETSINSNTNAGSFAAIVPSSAGGNDVLARSNGSVVASVTATSVFAPVTFVATQLLDIAAPLVSLTINNGSAAVISASQGSGNYGNHSLYLGARAGASLCFKGNVYQIIIRGAASSAAEISDAKTWVNSKTGAY